MVPERLLPILKSPLLAICALLIVACERSVEVPWHSVDIEFVAPARKMEMIDRLARTIGDCGFRVADNQTVEETIGRGRLFRFFVTRDQQVAANLHDVRGQTMLSINLFLSGFIDQEHADECWTAITAELKAQGYRIPP